MNRKDDPSVLRKARRAVEEYGMFEKGAQVVVGFSGGPDSLCLFDVLLRMADDMELTLIPVHVNHGLRGEASDGDQRFCEEFCAERGIRLDTVSIDCEAEAKALGVSTETAGRIRRYEAFGLAASRAASETGRETVVAVAHNADDRVETVLQHLLRGTGTAGLSSIPYVRPMETGAGTIRVVRPILGVTRREIEEYCASEGLSPRRDSTNDEPVYARNRIRLDLIPELEKYSPGVREALLRLADSAAEDEDVLKGLAEEAFSRISSVSEAGEIRLDGPAFRKLKPAVAKRVLKAGFARAGLAEDITSAHYGAMMSQASRAGSSGRIELPRGFSLEMEYGDLILRSPETEGPELPKIMMCIIAPEERAAFAGAREDGRKPLFYDADSFGERCPASAEDAEKLIEVRTRRAGDSIRLKVGTRRIQDLFVDMKVPKRERGGVPLIAAGSEVLFVGTERPRCTAAHAVTSDTKRVLCIEFIY